MLTMSLWGKKRPPKVCLAFRAGYLERFSIISLEGIGNWTLRSSKRNEMDPTVGGTT